MSKTSIVLASVCSHLHCLLIVVLCENHYSGGMAVGFLHRIERGVDKLVFGKVY